MTKDFTQAKSRKLEVVAVTNYESEVCRTFVLHGEDHTLGNALRYVVMKNADTEFCGYSVPHPSENKINFRIQTKGPSAVDMLKTGLNDLSEMCGHVLSEFERSVEKHKRNREEPMEK